MPDKPHISLADWLKNWEWFAYTSKTIKPFDQMVKLLTQKVSKRKLKLFSCVAVELVNCYGYRVENEEIFYRNSPRTAVHDSYIIRHFTHIIECHGWEKELQKHMAKLPVLQDIVYNPFDQIPSLDSSVLSWNDQTIPKIAKDIYEKSDFARMPILADALEDAGLENQEILQHCRSGNKHYRGCWVVDLLTGQE